MSEIYNVDLNTAQEIIQFLQGVFTAQHKDKVVIGVSGGIDSALCLTLLTKALGSEKIYPLMLPHGQQDMSDAKLIIKLNQIPAENVQTVNIEPAVDQFITSLNLDKNSEIVRIGNLMARVRMTMLFDRAKGLDALVCGTENKSEKFLAYYTRFGDEASDIEPIVHLYKTQVRQLFKALDLPEIFLKKQPSAGLWDNQTDEHDFGFSYSEADQFFMKLEQAGLISSDGILFPNADSLVSGAKEELVMEWVKSMQFKHLVPYKLNK